MGTTPTHREQSQPTRQPRHGIRRGAPLTDQAVELVAFRLRLFAEPTRIRLLELLNDGEASVQELSDQLDTTYQNVSRHLNVIYQAGILTRRKVDASVRYALADWTGWWLIEQVSGTLADRLDGLRAAFDPTGEERWRMPGPTLDQPRACSFVELWLSAWHWRKTRPMEVE